MDQEKELIEISGTVDSVIYKNEENSYAVLRLRTDSDYLINVVGCFPYAAAGESMVVTGEWMTHMVHGRQFRAEFAQRLLPSSKEAIYQYLAAGTVRGIGPALAALIVERFEERSLDVIENDPLLLSDVKGISISKANQMSASFRRQAGVRRLMEFICSYGIRPVLALRLYKCYGDRALDLVRFNPYVLAAEHIGGSFMEADKMALEMGLDGFCAARLDAAIIFELVHNSKNGHCFIPRDKLANITYLLIGVGEEDIDERIGVLIDTGKIINEQVAGCDACYLPQLYEAETSVAQRLAAMCLEDYNESFDIEKLIKGLEEKNKIKYAPLQRQTLELALNNQLLVVTGGPGTGKTTIIRAILAMYERMGLKTLLTAPTGRAAKRMSDLSGAPASTVHRLLGAQLSEDGQLVVFEKCESEQLECDAIILDECSMVDICLMDALLKAMPPEARLVLVGDADQLPSVGPGNVFSAVIRSEVAPAVRLTEIFRQSGEGRIVRNAHMINRGEHPDFSENTGDFFRLRRLQAASSVETISELFAVRLPNKMHINPRDIQVLTPTRKGELGTVNLNRVLQEALNPRADSKAEKVFGETIYRVGDRVMQIKNNYDVLWWNDDKTEASSGIFNGDIGYIEKIDQDQEAVYVDFDGRHAAYSFELLGEIEHAWAMTVHKAQGSEYRAVIFALSPASNKLLTRDVFYTGVTRARELLILVGDDNTAHLMIDNYKKSNRYTALRVRMRKLCAAI